MSTAQSSGSTFTDGRLLPKLEALSLFMLYDFNIPYPSNPDPSDLRRLERILFRIQSSNAKTGEFLSGHVPTYILAVQNATIALNLTTTDAFVAKTAEVRPLE